MSTLLAPGLRAVAPAAPEAAGLPAVLATARDHAAVVDRDGRFPAETFAVLREEGLLAALVPPSHGGKGQSLKTVAATCYALGRCCASSAMILAMHHVQVACLLDHAGGVPWLRQFIDRVGRENLLLASVTSETGIGGNMRTSLCGLEPEPGGRFRLTKTAPTVSYGVQADALLVTARSHPDAAPPDQVLVVVPAAPGVLTRTGRWDAMGMRGTGSDAFLLEADGHMDQVIPAPFGLIASQTMVPVSHLLWASVWCGIASDAVLRARRLLRSKMRAGASTMPDGAGQLVAAAERLQCAEARVRLALAEHETAQERNASLAETASISMLKSSVSEACLAVTEDALLVCGFAGYSNAGPFSLSRHLRDLHSARLMVHNDRIRHSTARLLMAQEPALGLD